MLYKIGIFGGSFNPVHFGHLQIANFFIDEKLVDEIYFVPNFLNPLKKTDSEWIEPHHKLKMLQLALQTLKNSSKFHINTFEIDQPQKSYTLHTLRYFRKKFPNTQLFFICGDDILNNIDRWYNLEEVLSLCSFLVYNRSLQPLIKNPRIKKYSKNFIFTQAPFYEISSNKIRSSIQKNEGVNSLTPSKVVDYILKEKLYVFKDTHHETIIN